MSPSRTERMHAWARNAPEDWGSLPALVQDQMIAHRVTLVQPQSGPGKAVEWGVLACLGLQLAIFYADEREAQRVEAWGRFGEAVPRALLDHESTPGVPDGWALLVGLYHRCTSQSGGFNGEKYEEMGRAVVNTWSLRMLEGVPREEWGRQWQLNMVKATAALLEQATPEQQGRLSLPLSGLVSDPRGWRAADSPGPALRQELAELILCTRIFRKALVAGTTETLLDGLKRSIGGRTYPLRESPTDLWTSMLALYAEHQRRLKASTNGRYDLSVRFLERVMKGWLETGVVPTGIQEHKVRAGLGMLAQYSPTLHTALTQARLQEALGTADNAEIQPRPRVRL